MKKIIFLILVIIVVGFIIMNKEENNIQKGLVLPNITPVEHASFVMDWGELIIYNDPVGGEEIYTGLNDPDIILLSDIHGDHLDIDTLEALVIEKTILVAPSAVVDELPEALSQKTKVMANGEKLDLLGLKIEALPMYNLPESETAFHPKGRGNGYLMEDAQGVRVYIAGDTEDIPEMRALSDINIAFLPMNLPYTMDVDAAADAVLEFKPGHVIPYHYRGTEGLSDVEAFKEIVIKGDPDIEVLLLNWYNE